MQIIKDIMSDKVLTISYDSNVLSAALKMTANRIGCLVVMKNNRAVGVITERDILSKVVCKRRDPAEVWIKDIMSSPAITINHIESVKDAAKKMNQERIKKLVVVSKNKMVGIITTADIVKAEPEAYNEFIHEWLSLDG